MLKPSRVANANQTCGDALAKGFESCADLGPCVTVFGSARLGEEHRNYRMARGLGQAHAEK